MADMSKPPESRDEEQGYWAVVPIVLVDSKDIPNSAKLLYLILSSMAHRNGYCWPNNATLAEKMNLSKRRVVELLALLSDAGYVRIEVIRDDAGRVCRRNIYCGIFVSKGENTPTTSCDFSHDPPAEDCATSCEKSQDPPAKNTFPYIGRIRKENNKKEKDSLPSKPKFVQDIPPEICERILEYAPEDQDLQQAILDLLENRRVANKKPVKTMRAMDGILRDLDKHSGGSRDLKLSLLDKAVKCNWLTVYALKPDEMPLATPAGNGSEDGEIDGI